MKLTTEYREYLIELFESLGAISMKPVFGHIGLFAGGAMFGVVDRERRIYLKASEGSRTKYESEGSEPLRVRPRPNSELITTSFYSIPERLYDEPDELHDWARTACDEAQASPGARKKRERLTRRTARQPVRRRTRS